MSGSRPEAGLWCRQCGLAVIVRGEPEIGEAVHADTGREQGDGGHCAAPIEYETFAMRGARRLRREYAGYLEVALVYGTVIRATFLDPADRRCFEETSAGALERAADPALAPEALAVVTARRVDAAGRFAAGALR